jgi:F0F1-type ATP synthase gamma subunit
MQTKTITCDDVKVFLSLGADSRFKAQEKFDRLQSRYERLQTRLSLRAQTEKVIPTDKPGEFRAASNETERKWAARYVCQQSKEFRKLEAQYLEAQRQLQFYTDQQANFRVLAELMASGELVRPF